MPGAVGLADWISRVNWASDVWFQDGLPPTRHRRDSLNVVANYTFSRDSRFRGWTIGGSARWRGKPVLSRSFDALSNPVVNFGEPRMDTDFSLGYTRKLKSFTLKTQLNVRNVFNSKTVEVFGVPGVTDGSDRGHLQYNEPRNFRLTVDLIF